MTLAMFLLSLAAMAAQSFDCAKAAPGVEALICKDRQASDLDEQMARHYEGVRLALPDATECIRDDQRRWLRDVRNRCTDIACIRNAYLERISALNGLQPGANFIKRELPAVPALVWIFAPETFFLDDIPSAPLPDAQLMTLTGALVLTPESGFALRAPLPGRGNAAVDVGLGSIDGTAMDNLLRFAQGNRYSAEGYVGRTADGRPVFDNTRCVFLHRLP